MIENNLELSFSIFKSFKENFQYDEITIFKINSRIKEYKKVRGRIEKLISKGDVIFYVFDTQFLEKEIKSTDRLVIWAMLPKLPTDYIKGLVIWNKEKTWYNFKWIFKTLMLFPVLDVETIKEDIEVEHFDILLIQTNEEHYDKFDVVRYSKKWLKKYYPKHNLTVKYLEGE